MTTHTRSEDQTAISVSINRQLLTEIDKRAYALGFNRSQYLVQLAKSDLTRRGALLIQEASSPPNANLTVPQAEQQVVYAIAKEAKRLKRLSKKAKAP